MKNILLILLLLSTLNLYAKNRQSFFPVNVKGTFLNLGTHDPSVSGPTEVRLSNIDPSIVAGTIISVIGQGSYNSGPHPNETGMIAVFADDNGNYILPGPHSSYLRDDFNTYCNDDTIENPGGFLTGSDQGPRILEVPGGATRLLFGAWGCPVSQDVENTGNGGYGVNIAILPPPAIDVYQVVMNPQLSTSSTVIDLVQGKNADVVLNYLPNADIFYSSIKIGSGQTLYDSNDYDIDANGHATFHIDPAPSNVGTNPVDLKLTIKNDQGVVLNEVTQKVNILKTNSIKAAYIPIVCNANAGCFSKPSDSGVAEDSRVGNKIINNLFPIPNSDNSEPLVLNGAGIGHKIVHQFFGEGSASENCSMSVTKDTDAISKTLSNIKWQSQLFNSSLPNKYANITHLHGIFSSSYVQYHSDCLPPGLLGREYSEIKSVSLGIENHPRNVAHEIGHMLSLEDINDTPPRFSGYLNYDLFFDSDFHLARGGLTDQFSIMQYVSPSEVGKYIGQWLSYPEYVATLQHNLSFNKNKAEPNSSSFKISAIYFSGGQFSLVSSYFGHEMLTPNQVEGIYSIAVKDVDGNILNSLNFNPDLDDSGYERVNVDVGVPSNAITIDIYRQSYLVGTVVIPADTILEEVGYISADSVNGDFDLAISDITSSVLKFKDEVLKKQFQLALDTLENQIYFKINKYVKPDYVSATFVGATKASLVDIVSSSLLKVIPITSANVKEAKNEFTYMHLTNNPIVNSKSSVEFYAIKQPENKELMYVYEARFDMLNTTTHKVGGVIQAESVGLAAGQHQWAIQTYVVKAAEEKAFELSISKLQLNKFNLEKQYENESDPDIRAIINQQIEEICKHILQIKQLQLDSRLPLSSPLIINLEV